MSSNARRLLSVGVFTLGVATLSVPAFLASGCAYIPPQGVVSQEAVVQAAAAVIQERYPQSSAQLGPSQVVAITPTEMTGSSKSRRQISVIIRQNYTGNYEPVVRVLKVVDWASVGWDADPETAQVTRAHPLRGNEWHPLDYLPYEEQELYDAIRARIAPARL